MIQEARIQRLNRESFKDRDYVLYWMQASQRCESNHALEYAVREANQKAKPLLVFFGLTENYPEANERHYAFMLEGLREVKDSLEKRGIQFVLRHTSPEVGAFELSRDSCLIVVDRGYVRIERRWRNSVAREIDCPLIQVETNAVVPVEEVSPKEEFAARTIRPKIRKLLGKYLHPLREGKVRKDSLGFRMDSLPLSDIGDMLKALPVDLSVKPVSSFKGGTSEAKKRLNLFITQKLSHYPENRNDPNLDGLSQMSPYLHFGQISPLFIALETLKKRNRGSEPYLEELIIRRELSLNFVFYNGRYDRFEGLPRWALETLKEHEKDKREAVYARTQLEKAQTDDPYWNAAQKEMILTGKMHGYMRMYWGKRMLEWSEKPQAAFHTAIYLNNKYELDGRDPNGFTGVAWCFGKHDRAWPTRPIFGKVRSMTTSGLRKKFDADAYVRKIEEAEQEAARSADKYGQKLSHG